MPDTSKKLFQLTPRDWRDNDEIVARSPLGTQLIARKEGLDTAPAWRRLFIEIEGDPADTGLRDAALHALGIGRPR